MRHRVSIQDLSLLIAVLLVGFYIAFEVDIYENQDGVTKHQETVELDEALTLGGLLTVGLLVFAARRYSEQKRETRRRIAAEKHARELAHPRQNFPISRVRILRSRSAFRNSANHDGSPQKVKGT